MLNSLAPMESMGPFLAVANTLGKKKKDSWHADLHLMKSVQVRVSLPSNSASWQRDLGPSDF